MIRTRMAQNIAATNSFSGAPNDSGIRRICADPLPCFGFAKPFFPAPTAAKRGETLVQIPPLMAIWIDYAFRPNNGARALYVAIICRQERHWWARAKLTLAPYFLGAIRATIHLRALILRAQRAMCSRSTTQVTLPSTPTFFT